MRYKSHMNPQAGRLKHTIRQELLQVYEDGFDKPMGAGALPTLAAIARGLFMREDETKASDHDFVEALLHRAIARMQEDRRLGTEILLDLLTYREPRVTVRRDRAADQLGYGSGDSLRNSTPGKRQIITTIIEEVVTATLALGVSLPSVHRQIYGDTRILISALDQGAGPLTDYQAPVLDFSSKHKVLTLAVKLDLPAIFGQGEFPDWSHLPTTRIEIIVPRAKQSIQRVRACLHVISALIAEDSVDMIGPESFHLSLVPDSVLLWGCRHDSVRNHGATNTEFWVGNLIAQEAHNAGEQFDGLLTMYLRVQVEA
jgi:hypothetical protein